MDVILQVQRGSKRTPSIRLQSEETIVGRREGCDLRIPSSAVSRRHCRLSFRNDYLTVEDLDSSNGTFLNGVRVAGQQVVRPGDLLEIGPVTFLVKYQLTQAAINRLLEEGTTSDEEEVVEVEAVEPPEALSRNEAQNDRKKGRTTRRKTTTREPSPEKEKKGPASRESSPDEPPPMVLNADESLKLPAELDLRDILSQMEEDS